MAEFSKQYLDQIQDKMTPDFDVLEIFKTLGKNTMYPIICEGLGFNAIANMDGRCKVGFHIAGTDEYQWYPIELVTRYTHRKFLLNARKQVLLLEQDERGDRDLEQWKKSFELIVDQPYDEWKQGLKNTIPDDYYWRIEKDMYSVSCDAGDPHLKLHRIIK